MKRIFTILFLLCFGFSNATTYYIRTDGNNGNAGTTNSSGGAWRTCVYAAAHTSSGDIIYVTAGTFLETAQIVLPVGVSIDGVGATAILQSTLSADFTPMLIASSGSLNTAGNQYIRNVQFDGRSLTTYWGIHIINRGNFEISNCTFIDFKDRGVLYENGTGGDNPGDYPATYATGNTFHDNIMHNCAAYNLSTGVYGRGALNIGGQVGMLIYNNTISQTERPQGYNGWPIKYWNGGFLNDCKIYNNTLTKYPQHSYLGDGNWDFAIELFYVQGLEVYGNTMTGGGLDLNYQDKGIYSYSCWIHNNTFDMTTPNSHFQTGITLEFWTETSIIEDNIFKNVNCAVNYTPRPGSAVTNNIFRRNLVYGVQLGGPEGAFFITFGGSTGNNLTFNGLYVYNNTMEMYTGGTGAGYWGVDLPNTSTTGSTIKNIDIINNVIQGATSAGITQWSNLAIDSLRIMNNCLYQNGNSNAPLFDHANPTHYTYSGNLIGTNPLFVGGGNYTLQSGSTLIDAGLNVGLPYVGSAPDIGYAEYGSDVTAPTVTSTNPTNTATGVSISVHPLINFDEALNGATVTTSTAYITGVTSTVNYSAGTITITPTSNLAYSTTYTVTVTTGVQDVAGNALASNYVFTFTTGAAPAAPTGILYHRKLKN